MAALGAAVVLLVGLYLSKRNAARADRESGHEAQKAHSAQK